MRKVLIVDNFDSFTYNLFNYFLRLKVPTQVINRDKITIEKIKEID
ncbi:MAG: aminodeoxychorismate/anthranilate synthase component II, partial [Dictyoglomus sp.]